MSRSTRSQVRASWLVPLAALLLHAPPAAADSLARAVRDGEPRVDLRYRLERVDQEGLPEDARASTVRARLGFETGEFHGLFALGEFEAVRVLGDADYDDTANGNVRFPVVADPEDEEVNQLYLGRRLPRAVIRLGRQRIVWDNARFIGNVGWRQNEQTFDALTIDAEPTERIALAYAHLNNANRVFGEHHPSPVMADLDLFGDLLSARFRLTAGSLTVYTHWLELEDLPEQSHRNIGLRFHGSRRLTGKLELRYTAEVADQSDYKAADSGVGATYRLGELGLKLGRLELLAGHEVLGGDGVWGFVTPLATLHGFNGWADKFLATPAVGLRDAYLSLGGQVAGFRLLGVYHDFAPDRGGGEFGSELDLLVSRGLGQILGVELKYADYDAEGFATDTRKLWFSLTLKL